MGQKCRIDQRLALGLEFHIVRRLRIDRRINRFQHQPGITGPQLLFFTLKPLKLQPGSHAASQPCKSFQMRKLAAPAMKLRR